MAAGESQGASRSSLRLRLAVAGLLSLGLVFALAFVGLSVLFERHVERRVAAELSLHLDQIVANLRLDPGGGLALGRDPVDPRFTRPLSGLYWQIESGGETLRSRSLWDGDLALAPLDPGSPAVMRITGAGGRSLFAVEREVVGGIRLGNRTILAAVALDTGDIDRAVADFRSDMIPYFVVFALLLIAANLIQVHVGLRPLSMLRQRIAGIRSGGAQRLGGNFPREILPLTSEVDGLLSSREEQIVRARRQAADLAHGLKTPLQAISGDVERLRAAGEAAIARDIGDALQAMRRHVDHQLARARMADRAQARSTPVRAVIDRVLSVLERTPHGMMIDWRIDVAEHLAVQMDGEDLSELLGNLLDNAARYAANAVEIGGRREGSHIVLSIRDDGPGIPVEKLPDVMRRGGRLDESSGGAGLGLAIATEIAVSAGGELRLSDATPGVRAQIVLPAAS